MGSRGSRTLAVEYFHDTVVIRLPCSQGHSGMRKCKWKKAAAGFCHPVKVSMQQQARCGEETRAKSKGEPSHVLLVHLWLCISCISRAALSPSFQPRNDLNKCSLFKIYLRKGQGGCQGSFPIKRSLVEWLCRIVKDRSEPYAVVGSVDTRVGRSDTPWHGSRGFPVQV